MAIGDHDPARRVAGAISDQHDVVVAADAASAATALDSHALDVAIVDAAWITSELVTRAGVPVLAAVDPPVDFGDAADPFATAGADAAAAALAAGCADVVRSRLADPELRARVALAVRLARAERDAGSARAELVEASRTDHLSGLANRRHLDEHLAMAASSARRHRRPMSLLLVDVDHLKRVNDAIGHTAGDDVIRAIGHRIAHVLRGEDMAGRWGGDEVLVVAPSTDLDGAWRLGERIRDTISAAPVVLDGGRDVLITVSIGCSTGPGDDLEAQLRQAEEALDQARAAGRNRVVVSDASIMS